MIRSRAVLILMILLCSNLLWCQPADEKGTASYYHDSLEGERTASGEIFSQGLWTAAHKKLPFQTWVLLRDQKGREVVVRINDRLPAHSKRMIDLTKTAAEQLDMVEAGLRRVELTVITPQNAWIWFQKNSFWKPQYFYFLRF